MRGNLRSIQADARIFEPFAPATREQTVLDAQINAPLLSEAFRAPESADWAQEATPAGRPATGPEPIGGTSKRLMDIAVASIALVLAAPVMLLIAACTLATDGGPVIFAHRRVGFAGKSFNCYKFRTMRPDAAKALEAYLANNPDAAMEWHERKKLKHDPRITFFGKLLRLSSLDELPQLFNVLRGEMSCIGPRPVVADELQLYGASAHDYLSARPGITGLWQVSGRSSIDYADRVLLDTHYVRNWSVGADLVILLKTSFAVFRIDHAS